MAEQKYAIGKHPNSLKNLNPPKKGEPSRNPNGRPTNRLSLTNLAREKLDQPCPHDPKKTWLEYLVDRWLDQATENATYFKELLDRLEGKVVQPVEGTLEVKEAAELTDEQLAVIAATNIIKNNASGRSQGTIKETEIS